MLRIFISGYGVTLSCRVVYTAQPTPQSPRNEIISAMGCRVLSWVDQSVMGVGRATDTIDNVQFVHTRLSCLYGAIVCIFHVHDTQAQGAPTLALLYSCIQLYLSPETQAGWQGVECRVHVGRQYGHCIHSTSHCFADSYFQHSATISRPSSILRETNLDSDIHQPTHGDHSVPSGYSSSELSDT